MPLKPLKQGLHVYSFCPVSVQMFETSSLPKIIKSLSWSSQLEIICMLLCTQIIIFGDKVILEDPVERYI
jgi:hypothetical protein